MHYNLTGLEDCKVINDSGVCKLIHYFSNQACNSLLAEKRQIVFVWEISLTVSSTLDLLF